MKRLLLVSQQQFGYLTDSYAWCKYLGDEWEITYIGWDYEWKRLSLPGVTVHYVPRTGSKPVRLARFFRTVFDAMRSTHFDAAIVVYFSGCSIFRLALPAATTLLDIRTGSDRPRLLRRKFENLLLRCEAALFRHRSIVSGSLRKILGFSPAHCHVLPLGGETVPFHPKTFSVLRLFYVGTLDQRRIHETVRAFDRLAREQGRTLPMEYDIVGGGPAEDEQALRDAIAAAAPATVVRFHGRIPNAELGPFLTGCNIGVAYVPKRDYYDCQPSTKVFEYLLGGMPVIATDTTENALVIHPRNGVLVNDTEEGFYEGLKAVAARRNEYDAAAIARESVPYSWESIVRTTLAPMLRGILGPAGTPSVPKNADGGREDRIPASVGQGRE